MAQDIDAAIMKAAQAVPDDDDLVPLTPEEEAALGSPVPPFAGQMRLDIGPGMPEGKRGIEPVDREPVNLRVIEEAEPGDRAQVGIPIELLRRYRDAIDELRDAEAAIARHVVEALS